MCSGLYPNLVRVDYGKKKFKVSAFFVSHAAFSLPSTPPPRIFLVYDMFLPHSFLPSAFLPNNSCLFFETFTPILFYTHIFNNLRQACHQASLLLKHLPSPPRPPKQPTTKKKKTQQLLSADHSTLNPHPSSVTSEGNPFNRRWAYYHEMCRTPGGLFIYDLTEAAPLPLLLFGAGQRDPGETDRGGQVDRETLR